jgi:hypothetical protein
MHARLAPLLALALAACTGVISGSDPADSRAPTGAVCVDASALPARRLRLLSRREYDATVRDLLFPAQSSAGAKCTSDGDCDVARESCVVGACAPDPCGLHTFLLAASAPEHVSVHVSGSFNGWPATAASAGDGWTMRYVPEAGAYVVKHALADGDHEYKLVVDDEEWLADPASQETVGPFGNSVLRVSCAGAPTDASAAPLEPGKDLPPIAPPAGFPFDHSAETGLVTAVHAEQLHRAAAAVAARADFDALAPCLAAEGGRACAESFVRDLGRRAFRRPLTDAEIARYADLAMARPTLRDGLEAALEVFLQSPYFLYRFEVGAPRGDGTYGLTPHETATLLAYTLWGTMPDAALFDAADQGRLDATEGVEGEARRMLADPRARAAIGAFAAQWIGADRVLTAAKDDAAGAALAADMLDETRALAAHVVLDGSGRYDDLLTSDETLASDALRAFYGLEPARSGAAASTAPERAAGLLGHASVLGAYAAHDRSSPIQRGLFVRQRLLCQDLPPPPNDVPPLPPVDPGATTRDRFEQHTAVEACRACHQYLDPVGFGFEQFDAVGRYRAEENGRSVDASGDLADLEALGAGTHAPFDGLPALGRVVAGSEAGPACFARQVYRYASGHLEAEADACALARLTARFEAAGRDVRELFVATLTDPSFLTRR